MSELIIFNRRVAAQPTHNPGEMKVMNLLQIYVCKLNFISPGAKSYAHPKSVITIFLAISEPRLTLLRLGMLVRSNLADSDFGLVTL